MDIVLNTVFNNPNLPLVPVPGFSDTFNRATADTLGSTPGGKPWILFDSGTTSSTWGTYGNGTAGMKTSSSAYHLAVANALTPNGSLVAKLGTYDAAQRRPGLVIRAKDKDNFISIAPASSTVHEMRLAKRVAGVTTTLTGGGPALVAGDTVTVVANGSTITLSVNGVQALTASIPELVDATMHGMYAFTGAIGAWDSVEFIPA